MGAMEFSVESKSDNVNQAFINAVADAQWEYGHGGYTGTIAEKNGFVMVIPPKDMSPNEAVDFYLNDEDHFCQNKWGPAACMKIDDSTWVFFGWASS